MKTLMPLRGLTLIELCVTIATLSLLLAIAVPSYSNLVGSQRSSEAILKVYKSFKLARAEAIKRSTTVTLCPVDNSGDCSNDWNKVISVFADPDNSRSLTGAETILYQIPPPEQGSYRAAPHTRRYFQFSSLGSSRGTLGNITYCPPVPSNHEQIRQLVLNLAGRVRLLEDEDDDGFLDKSNGAPVTCIE